ncbi:MAG: hypothetical protein LKCHEGNO_02215 [Burkholderiaceae bacterium]|nr:hypothetical protein [Burkholderiaceae bacterium]
MNDESGQSRSAASRGEFVALARERLTALDPASGRDVTLVDVDFTPWPLDEPAVVDALTRWIQLPGRRLRLVGMRFDLLERHQPRFAAWRKPFAHALECLRPTEVDPSDMPSLLWLEGGCLELLDREHWQGRWSTARRARVQQRERIDALLQRCEPAWPVTVLGL